MTVDSSLSAENIKSSLEKYMYDRFVTIDGLIVHWEGAKDIDTNTVDEWVQPRTLYGAPEFGGWINNSKRGQLRPILLNINIFVRKDSTNNTHRLTELRDIVANYFNVGQVITLKDYRGTGASVDSFIVRDVMTDTNFPTGDQLYWQWVYTPVLYLVQGWTV
jgi:hypothetical protein